MSAGLPREGWSWLRGAAKRHYFREGVSLCWGWMTLSLRDLTSEEITDHHNCKVCQRKREKEKESIKC